MKLAKSIYIKNNLKSNINCKQYDINFNILLIIITFICSISGCSSNVNDKTQVPIFTEAPPPIVDEQIYPELVYEEYTGLLHESLNYSYYYKTILNDVAYYVDKTSFLEQECSESIYYNVELKPVDAYYSHYKNSENSYNINDKNDTAYIKYKHASEGFVHEYVHYITYMTTTPMWMSEGLSEYLRYYIASDLLKQSIDDYLSVYEEHLVKYLDIQEKSVNDINMGEFCDLASYLEYRDEVSKINLPIKNNKNEDGAYMTYKGAGSMVNYLMTEYGSDAFMSAYKGELTLIQAYGKKYEELYEEYIFFLYNKFNPLA